MARTLAAVHGSREYMICVVVPPMLSILQLAVKRISLQNQFGRKTLDGLFDIRRVEMRSRMTFFISQSLQRPSRFIVHESYAVHPRGKVTAVGLGTHRNCYVFGRPSEQDKIEISVPDIDALSIR